MIILRQPLQLEYNAEGACLVLWLCEPFDPEFSFRIPLARVQQILSVSAPTTMALPPEQRDEDFIDGRLVWGKRGFAVYFERSLGYAQFSSLSSEDVEALQEALAPNTSIERPD
jgi:hypothetical protein